MLKHLNEVNSVKIYSVFDPEFLPYGRVIEGYDVSPLISYLKEKTQVPEVGNCYFPSIEEMEAAPVAKTMRNVLYGGMDIQIGYCNGTNSNYNAFEYHKGSEINVAVTPLLLVLGHVYQIKDNQFHVGDEKVFFVPEGTVIEMYQTTLHFSPCKVSDAGFKDVIILPKGTNTPLETKETSSDPESKLLFMKNKWLLAHPEREPLIQKGAYPGLIGENKKLNY